MKALNIKLLSITFLLYNFFGPAYMYAAEISKFLH